MKRESVVIGISNHNGWAAFVCVADRDGAPAVIDRRRVELIDPGLPNQPYEHESRGLDLPQAEALVKEVRESALICAERALGRARTSLGTERPIVAIAMREAVLPEMPKSVAEVRASYHLMARADSMMYHDALCQAASGLGIAVELIARGKERALAAATLGSDVARLDRWLLGLRASLGAPWQTEHQDAAARAIFALSKQTPLKLPG